MPRTNGLACDIGEKKIDQPENCHIARIKTLIV